MEAKTARAVLLGLALSACAPGGLADLPEAELRVDGPYDAKRPLDLYVSYEGTCTTLGEDLAATVNGQPFVVETRGGSYSAGIFDSRCSDLHFTGPVPPPGAVTVRVWDHSGEMQATFPDLFYGRRLELVEPADGTLYVGDQVRLRLSPATDLIVDAMSPGYRPASAVSVRSKAWLAKATVAGSDITFEAPRDGLSREGLLLNLTFDLYQPDVFVAVAPTACRGAARCRSRPQAEIAPAQALFWNHRRGEPLPGGR